MEETPQRLDRVSKLEELGPEVEALFTRGLAQVPLVMSQRVDPVVRLLRSGSNVALVGRSGVGKRSIAYGLRRSDVWSEDPQLTLPLSKPGAHPNSWPVYRTTVRHWMDGAIYVGNLEQKINLICRRTTTDCVVLFEAIHTAVGAWRGRDESLDLIDLLVDVASHPKIHMVVTTTPEGWTRLREKKPDFTSEFVVVEVEPPNETESRMIVSFGLGDSGSLKRKVTGPAIDEAFRLATRYFPDESQLGPSMRLLKAAVPAARGRVEPEAVREACASELGVQRRWIGSDRAPQASTIIDELEGAVLGQRAACAAIADDFVAAAHGLTPTDRPRSYLLAGTPGVGKTSLACAVQRLLGGEDAEPLRFDCSEYAATPLDALRLLANEPGSLTTGLMRSPGAVVLLDEVDRLHPSARDLLYQMLGEGRLTTLGGETVSCSNAVVFMTTNVGSTPWLRSVMDEGRMAQAAGVTRSDCVKMLGAAIASRVTRILVFPPLRIEHTAAIIRAELARIASAPSLKSLGVTIEPSDGLVVALATSGLSSSNGARGLHKVIHEAVAIPVSRFLSEHPSARGVLTLEALLANDVLEGVRVSLVEDKWPTDAREHVPRPSTTADSPEPTVWN